MAVTSICGKLSSDFIQDCKAPVKRFHQQAVLINKDDIDTSTITLPSGGVCDYNVEFALKAGKTGYLIAGIEAGSSFFGSVSKSRDDNGYPVYTHNVTIFLSGVDEKTKCILDSLDSGNYVVAMQYIDGTVVVYGFQNGLSTSDYDYSAQENAGGASIVLSSSDAAPENSLPLVYKSSTAGNEGVDFDDKFKSAATP